MTSAARRRLAGALCAAVLVAAGLALHRLLPGTLLTDIAGDALYAALIYTLVVLAVPRARAWLPAAVAVLWCTAVELFQLTGLPLAWGAQFPPVRLILGTGFDTRDLVVYVAAIALALALDAATASARAARSGTTGNRSPALRGSGEPGSMEGVSTATAPRRWLPYVIGAAVLLIAGIVLVAVLSGGRGSALPVAATTAPPATPRATPTPTPTPTGAPADPTAYDVTALPAAEVFAVIPALPVDADPASAVTGFVATPVATEVPVFAEPGQAPVARLPLAQTYGGSTVPVVEKQENWVRVLLSGRQGIPGEGNPAQLSGWLRTADVTLAEIDTRIEVNLSARTVTIVSPAGTEVVATDFGWGTDATPTPLGRTFIMHTQVVPEFGYTRGHPLVYLGVQSATLAGFGGADVAVTAFHYHDARSGAISNGCLRLDAAAIDRLAQLPLGTPVIIGA